MQRRAFTFPSFLLAVLRFPLITWAVQFLIHFQVSGCTRTHVCMSLYVPGRVFMACMAYADTHNPNPQALRLWLKKVPFYSHPDGTETAASRFVATLAAPLWKLQELSKRGGKAA